MSGYEHGRSASSTGGYVDRSMRMPEKGYYVWAPFPEFGRATSSLPFLAPAGA